MAYRPPMTLPSGFKDPNQGGGPGSATGGASIPQRGGAGASPRQPTRTRAARGKAPKGNPASRGGSPVHMSPHSRVPGHGGSPQHRGGHGTGKNFGNSGQSGVPSYPHSNPQPGAGNTSGQASKMISGRFKRSAMKVGGGGGGYGGSPVSLDT